MPMDSRTWIIEAVRINNGYGISRLLTQLHARFPEEKGDWNLQGLVRFLTGVDHRNDWTLYDDIQVSDSGRKSEFHDPEGYDDKSNRIITPKTKPTKDKKKSSRTKKKEDITTPKDLWAMKYQKKRKSEAQDCMVAS